MKINMIKEICSSNIIPAASARLPCGDVTIDNQHFLHFLNNNANFQRYITVMESCCFKISARIFHNFAFYI